jgi:hypothetical protein
MRNDPEERKLSSRKLGARLEARMRVYLKTEMASLLSLSVNDTKGLGYPCVSSSEEKTVLHCPALAGSRVEIFSSACAELMNIGRASVWISMAPVLRLRFFKGLEQDKTSSGLRI